jgi:hypothetical protein
MCTFISGLGSRKRFREEFRFLYKAILHPEEGRKEGRKVSKI